MRRNCASCNNFRKSAAYAVKNGYALGPFKYRPPKKKPTPADQDKPSTTQE